MPSPASASRDPAGPRFAVNSYSTPHNSVYDGTATLPRGIIASMSFQRCSPSSDSSLGVRV